MPPTAWVSRFLLLSVIPLMSACGSNGARPLEAAWNGLASRLAGRGAPAADTTKAGPSPARKKAPHPRESAGRTTPAASEGAPRTTAHLAQLLSELRQAQAETYAIDRTYSASPGALGVQADPGVQVRIIWASSWGWAAVARDSARPSVACAIYLGIVPYPESRERRITGGRQGVPLCEPAEGGSGTALRQLLAADAARMDLTGGAMALMRHDLVQLAASQRQHHAVHGTYARRFNLLALRYVATPGVKLRILSADATSWAAEATYEQLPGMSCVIWGGEPAELPATLAMRRQPEFEGVPACDDDGSEDAP